MQQLQMETNNSQIYNQYNLESAISTLKYMYECQLFLKINTKILHTNEIS